MGKKDNILGLTENSGNDVIKEKAFKIISDLRWVGFSTIGINGKKPENRIFSIDSWDDGNLYFGTAPGKPVYEELMKNPNVAITLTTKDWLMVKISAEVARVYDEKQISKFWDMNPGIKILYEKAPDRFKIFCFKKGEGELFDLGPTNIMRLRFGFGGVEPRPIRYSINDECDSCGECVEVCTVEAIISEDQNVIDPKHCLECGACYDVCPVNAIQKSDSANA
jgi:uncharacterized pyridoxamine 5'-phosphate oxidase family protein/NAD-dependent dihydropyrimidine dehydrogenase PreA subunit